MSRRFLPVEGRAAARAAAKEAIYRALEALALAPEDRVVVLEDVLFETRTSIPTAPAYLEACALVAEEAAAPTPSTAPEEASGGPVAADVRRLWGRILKWCREHPNPSGYHEVPRVATAVLAKLPPRRAQQRVYVEVKRKTRRGPRTKPLFEFHPGSKQRFRLVEEAEAQGNGGAAKES